MVSRHIAIILIIKILFMNILLKLKKVNLKYQTGKDNVNVLKNINAYPFPGSQGSYGWHGTAGPYFKIDPKENMILILLTNMKGWDYSRKEIFEINTYNSLFKL